MKKDETGGMKVETRDVEWLREIEAGPVPRHAIPIHGIRRLLELGLVVEGQGALVLTERGKEASRKHFLLKRAGFPRT